MNVLDAIAVQRIARAYTARAPKRPLVESVVRNASFALSEGAIQPLGVYIFSGRNLVRATEAALGDEAAAGDVDEDGGEDAARREKLSFMGAPVGLICTMPKEMDDADILEQGGFIYAISLTAAEFGLAASVIREFCGMENRLAAVAGLDVDAEQISAGLALGYPEEVRPQFHDQQPSAIAEALVWR